ncbi:MAG: class I SAM-dependent methyltransferase [Pseudomonadales bacterium]|nr:class I SAM-dependent methyltransferase [Pseudomonadales bacterium]
MANGATTLEFSKKEDVRKTTFERVWSEELDDVFKDIATYYDNANNVASLGLLPFYRKMFLRTIDVNPGERALDVCAGTNAIGIALLNKERSLNVTAIDRSRSMQEVGRQRAQRNGFHIKSIIDDVHHLPFDDNSFDVVTLQFASRHLQLIQVFKEIHRVLRPGGRFYHSDMLRPPNKTVEKIHYAYLNFCLTATAAIFRSGPSALNLRKYFVEVLSLFYSPDEMSALLRELGFVDVTCKTLIGGILGFHRAVKPEA